jgi:hypothetical protein
MAVSRGGVDGTDGRRGLLLDVTVGEDLLGSHRKERMEFLVACWKGEEDFELRADEEEEEETLRRGGSVLEGWRLES